MGSQVKQDEFVLNLIKKGTFLDIGCREPEDLNNTMLLEQNGWTGVSIDKDDYSKEWKEKRSSLFICADALTFDYRNLAPLFTSWVFDYLSLDIEGDGDRYKALVRVLQFGFEFKVITIEHDSYRVPAELERDPQRKLLKSLGYRLLYPDISMNNKAFEDWWINPEYIKI
jgi:hypothetical protein